MRHGKNRAGDKMSGSLARWVPSWALAAVVAGALPWNAQAAQIAVHHPEGTLHGYLALRSESGQVLGEGDLIQVVRGDRVTSHLVFHFKDGSLDDETTVFTQRHNFRLISDHHIQKGPFFAHSTDMWVDVPKGEVTVQIPEKDSKGKAHAQKMKLPTDLCSPSMIITIAKNLTSAAAGTQVSMVVATPKPRLVKLAFSALGDDTFSVAGFERRALHYQIKFDLGGLAGLVAPLVGKQPPDIEIWIEPGEVPAFVKEEGPLSEGGPVVSIQETGPQGPKTTDNQSGK